MHGFGEFHDGWTTKVDPRAINVRGAGGDPVKPWFYFGSTTIASGSTSIFVSSNLDSMSEGLLLGFDFYIQSEDYQTSPVTVVTFGANTTTGVPALEPLKGPVSRNGNMFFFPSPYGVFFRKDSIIGLQVKNNESSSQYVEGRICGISWSAGQRPAWVKSLVGGF